MPSILDVYIFQTVCRRMTSAEFYLMNSELDVDEDATHEFKGHRNFSYEEMPRFVLYDASGKPTRQPLSKAICSFLNSLEGGTIYCGVTDEGIILGLGMLQCQREHVVLALDDLLQNRFTPSVPKCRYDVEFVPVRENEDCDVYDIPCPTFEHVLRVSQYCKCDKYAEAQNDNSRAIPCYVIHINIHPPSEVKAMSELQARTIQQIRNGTLNEWPVFRHPTLYCNEEDSAFIRHHALDRSIGELDLVEIQYDRASRFYHPISQALLALTIQEQNALPVNTQTLNPPKAR